MTVYFCALRVKNGLLFIARFGFKYRMPYQ
ncbi:hypothetical protein SGGMMB4_01648 [Sodalis glossinidius str. 'morsitans']|uniref:Uncharacterized protein n=1 Tax=Sodalis glossinidius (strain morsitans) TaxID=343509 RepID=A0A193QH54_SODGM|nr:hypothetical protein SGGMMB4_01648 [Sodalis glossinidius str. 'morsitans']